MPNWIEKTGATTPPAMVGSAMVFSTDLNKLLLIMGWDDSSTYYETVHAWNGTDWDLLSSNGGLTNGVAFFAAAYFPNELLAVVHGGYYGTQVSTTSHYDDDPTPAWTEYSKSIPYGPMSLIGCDYVAAADKMYMFGGYDGTLGAPRSIIQEYEPNASSITEVTTSGTPPSARCGSGWCYDSDRGVFVVYGGENYPTVFGTTHEIDIATWTWVTKSPGSSPGLLTRPCMRYDPIRQKTLLYGGNSSLVSANYFDEVWEWDGTNWAQLLDGTGAPAGRWGAAMEINQNDGNLILFGGANGSGPLDDTWELNFLAPDYDADITTCGIYGATT